MINYGGSPKVDEFEVTLFGPGYGEAIAIHLGDSAWILIDSCINPDTQEPASLEYLQAVGVDRGDVKTIVASHWHDDHVRGLSKLTEAFADAEIVLSAVFNDREAFGFLCAYGSEIAGAHTGGAKELYKVIRNASATNRKLTFALARLLIAEPVIQGKRVRVLAFAPTASAFGKAAAHFASYIPRKAGMPLMKVTEIHPNLEAVVVHVDLGDDAVLFGSDLESHEHHGWPEVCGDEICVGVTKASLFKVAHHGSISGHSDEVWRKLLKTNPDVGLTPFNNGAQRLPTNDDRERIRGFAENCFISSGASRRPQIPRDQLARMNSMCRNIAVTNSGFGAVRFRKKR